MVSKQSFLKYFFLSIVLFCGFVIVAGFLVVGGIMYQNALTIQSAPLVQVANIDEEPAAALAMASGEVVVEESIAEEIIISDVKGITLNSEERSESFDVSAGNDAGAASVFIDSQPNSEEIQIETGRGSFSSNNPDIALPVFSDTLSEAQNVELLSLAQSASISPQTTQPTADTQDTNTTEAQLAPVQQDAPSAVAVAQPTAETVRPTNLPAPTAVNAQPTSVPAPQPTPTFVPAPTIAAPEVVERANISDQAQQFLGSIFGRAPEPAAPVPTAVPPQPEQQAASAPAAAPHPSGLPIPELPPAQYSEIPYLIIPRLDLYLPVGSVPIRSGVWDTNDLGDRIGLLPTIGQKPHDQYGMVIGGHVTLSATQAGPFLQLSRLETGDVAIYRWKGVDYVYVLNSANSVDPSSVESLYVKDGANLILITCGTWDANQRVFAERLLTNFRLVYEGPSS